MLISKNALKIVFETFVKLLKLLEVRIHQLLKLRIT